MSAEDDVLVRYLGPELLRLLLRPPPVPREECETRRPPAESRR